MKRRKIAIVLAVTMLLNIIQINYNPIHAASLNMKWNKNDTLDSGLQLVQNKAGDEDILLELNMEAVGNYSLEYFLEDSRRTTVSFKQQYDRVVVGYKVEEMVDPIAQTYNNITDDQANLSFLEMDYTLAIPDWKFISNKSLNASGEIEYTIMKSAGSVYPGVAFNINGKKVIIRWDFQSNKLYYLMTGYTAGTIMPVEYTDPANNVDTLKILKALEGFNVAPTHLMENPDPDITENIEVSPITNPGDEKPGARPGMRISFKQPKELNTTDWTYNSASDLSNLNFIMELEGVGSSVYTDINFNLNNLSGTSSKAINELPDNNGAVEYVYNTTSQAYSIDIVKNKTDLADQGQIIQWDALEASKIYNININVQKGTGFSDYEFTEYLPESKFGYTFMQYELRRANMTEAYLDITPFDVGSQDEVEYTILYSKEQKDTLDPDNDLWVRHYYSGDETQENIFIPVPFRGDSSQDFYQIIVNFAGVDLKSQLLNYRAKEDLNIPPTTPRIEEVDRLYVVPSDSNADTLPMKAQFDLVWTAPDNKSSKELDAIFTDDDGSNRIFYELMINDVPTDTTDNPFQVIKVFEVFKDGDDYKLAVHEDLDGLDPFLEPSETVNYSDGYNSIEQLFRMEQITLYGDTAWAPVITTVASEDTNTYSVSNSGTAYNFEYPGVNYIRVRAITRIAGKIGISYPSIPYSLSLSPTAYSVPIAEELSYDPIITDEEDTVGIALDWHTVDINEYIEAMLTPVRRSFDNLYYGIYISESSSKIKDLSIPDADNLDAVDPYIKIGNSRDDITELDIELNKDELQALRDKEVLYFDVETVNPLDLNTILTSNIEGLDKNTNYYVRIVTKAQISNDDDSYVKIKMSDPSTMLSITTPSVPVPPDDSEVKPLSVEDLEVTFADASLLSGKVSWTYPDEITLEKDKFAFEIVSIEDKALADQLKLSSIMLEDLMVEESLEDDHLEYWRVYVDEINGEDVPILVKYDEVTDTWEIQEQALLEIGDQSVAIIDESNTPNRVYYYYVRTINIKGDLIMSASPWQMDTLTTIPVKGPINLAPSYDSGYTYNAKTQSIIRFDAPIPDDAVIGADFMMEIFVKGEEDEDYTMTEYPAVFLKEGDNAPTGFRRLYYRISDLKPGKAYSIKVRIEDRTIDMELLPDGTLTYPKSAYSERIIVRTEFDQGEYDKEVKFKEYLEYFDLKVKDLESGAYVVLESTSSKNIVKYRDNYGEGELLLNANGTYTLFTEDVKTNIIYLPANFIETANAKNVTLMIKPNEHSLSVRPYALGKGITTAINDKVNEIKKANSSLLDYYVKVTVECSSQSGTILSKTPSSAVIAIKMEVVGSEALEEDIDDLMIKELKSVINFRREALKEALAAQLLIGLDEEKMLDITKDAVESVKENYQFGANLVFIERLESTTKAITTVAKNILIGLKPKSSDFGLQVYKKSGSNWIKLQSSYNASKYIAESMDLTSFVLLPYEASGTSVSGEYTDIELDIINRYSLYEVFNSSELSNTSTNLTKYRMLSAFARVLGMTAGSSEAQYLKDKGITFSSTNMYADLTRAEVLYLYTQVYAAKNNIKLSNVYITNYNLIQDINKVNAAYKNTLLIGANMNIFTLTNGMLLPDNKVTIKEFIELLTKIETGYN